MWAAGRRQPVPRRVEQRSRSARCRGPGHHPARAERRDGLSRLGRRAVRQAAADAGADRPQSDPRAAAGLRRRSDRAGGAAAMSGLRLALAALLALAVPSALVAQDAATAAAT